MLAPSFGLGLGGPYAGAAVAAGLPGFGALALAQGALSGATPSLRALPQPLPMATVLLVSNLNEEVHVFFVIYFVLSMMICSSLKMTPLIKDIFEKSRAIKFSMGNHEIVWLLNFFDIFENIYFNIVLLY